MDPSIILESSPQDLASSIKQNIETFCPSISIFKVPDKIVSDNSHVFVPVKVSIGPFHQGSTHLKSMEDHKWRYLCAFLKHYPSINLDDLVKLIQTHESRVRKCYTIQIELDSDKFTTMMLLDCCFILELFLRHTIKSFRCRNDLIFMKFGFLFELRCDMILLENQVPFFLLREIFDLARIQELQNYSLNELAFQFFSNLITGERQFVRSKFMQESDHLLGMVHYSFLSTYPQVGSKQSTESPTAMHSASTLHKKCIILKKTKNPKSLLDIDFRDGVLWIPHLKVHKRTETIFWNLIVYEQRQFGIPWQVESYVHLMSHLLQSNDDVKLLHRRKILTDHGKDEKNVIRNLEWMRHTKSSFSGDYFAGIVQKVEEGQNTCGGLWRRLRRRGAWWPAFLISA